MDADPGIQLQPVGYAEPLAADLHALEDGEAGPCGASGGVFVGERKPEARQQPLFAALHDRAAELLHGLLARLEKRPQHVRLILRVECQIRLGLERVAATDQDGQLAALGLTGAPHRRGRPRVDGRWEWASATRRPLDRASAWASAAPPPGVAPPMPG